MSHTPTIRESERRAYFGYAESGDRMDVLAIDELLRITVQSRASDLHITVFLQPVMRLKGSLVKVEQCGVLKPQDTESYARQVLGPEKFKEFMERGEYDTSYSVDGLGRFRVNAYKQRGSVGIAFRVIALKIPTMEDLNLPPVVKELSMKKRGLILVTGPTGSGKSTTLASMLDYVNRTKPCHILTLEDPIEYLHKHQLAMINQREVGADSGSFSNALRAALRQDPDIILVGEMRDFETISIAITAAETGHLVMSTLHTIGAAATVDRIIDVFPPHQQQQIKVQLANALEGVISQQLLKTADERGRVAAFEIMTSTPAIKNLIREGKTHQIQSSVQTGSRFGMRTMDGSIMELYRDGEITKDTALTYCVDREQMERMM